MTSRNKTPYWATPFRLKDRFVTLQQDETGHDWHAFTISQQGTDRVVRWPEVAGQRTQEKALARLEELYKARHDGLTRQTGELFDSGERVLLRRTAQDSPDSVREPLTVVGTVVDPATGFMQACLAERAVPLPLDQLEREAEPDAATLARIPNHDAWMTTEQKAQIGHLALDHRQWYKLANQELLEAKAAASEAKKTLDGGVTEYNRQVTLRRARFWQDFEAAERARQDESGLFAGLEDESGSDEKGAEWDDDDETGSAGGDAGGDETGDAGDPVIAGQDGGDRP